MHLIVSPQPSSSFQFAGHLSPILTGCLESQESVSGVSPVSSECGIVAQSFGGS